MRVIVTRPVAEAAEWVEALRAHGFDALALPLIDIGPPPDAQQAQAAWTRLAGYRAAMFVSANAVRTFVPPGGRWPDGPRAWATGPGTQRALLAAGVPHERIDAPAADAGQFDSEALWPLVQGQCRGGDRVLLVRGGTGRDWLEQQLAQSGVAVEKVASYSRTAPTWDDGERATANEAVRDTWLFSSSQAVANLLQLLPLQHWRAARAIATHPRIAQAARAAGFGVVRESRPALADVVAALESAG